MSIALIVAMAQNRVIGQNGKMPWHISDEAKYFKATTMGKPLVMGRKTWESIGRPLPGRANIVVSRNAEYQAPGATVVSTVSEALRLAETMAEVTDAEEVMVMGGAELYERTLPLADRIYLTKIHRDYDGETVFPELNHGTWHEVSREERDGDPAYSLIVLERTAR
ncbi:MAG: dihydrofolate reductase [Alphaproteobacteria bacterium]